MNRVIPKAEIEKDSLCDGCNILMSWDAYQDHECKAYVGTEWRNPLAHKLSVAAWKVPKSHLKGELSAAGCIRKPTVWQLIYAYFFR